MELRSVIFRSLKNGKRKKQKEERTESKRFKREERYIIIGILQMRKVLIGTEKESNNYAL